jgi:hypothetical protein
VEKQELNVVFKEYYSNQVMLLPKALGSKVPLYHLIRVFAGSGSNPILKVSVITSSRREKREIAIG